MSRYCPYCGSTLADDPSICPRCSFEIAEGKWTTEAQRMVEVLSVDEFRTQINRRKKSYSVAVILSILPAFFGILGLGQIYLDRRDRSGFVLLATGIVMYLVSAVLIYAIISSGFVTAALLAIALLLFGAGYLLTAFVSIRHACTGRMR